jgi:hypothetical protein
MRNAAGVYGQRQGAEMLSAIYPKVENELEDIQIETREKRDGLLEATADTNLGLSWRPHGESNPGRRRERAVF